MGVFITFNLVSLFWAEVKDFLMAKIADLQAHIVLPMCSLVIVKFTILYNVTPLIVMIDRGGGGGVFSVKRVKQESVTMGTTMGREEGDHWHTGVNRRESCFLKIKIKKRREKRESWNWNLELNLGT